VTSPRAQSKLPPRLDGPRVINHVLLPASARDNMPEQYREPIPGLTVYVVKGEHLATGGTAYLDRLPSGHVIKTPIPYDWDPADDRQARRNMRIEAQIYQKIGPHPRVPEIVEWDPVTDCLTMEYMENGDLREYIRRNQSSGVITLQLRLRWARQAAEGLQALHAVGVVHCDVSPRNFLLDCNLDLKIADFAGSSLSGSEPSAAPSERFQAPGMEWNRIPGVGEDIFGLGSLIYFIMTEKYPHEEIPSDEVVERYERHEFPELSNVYGGSLIKDCWEMQVQKARDIVSPLEALEKECEETDPV
jgi:serine/threonine protein kinase